MMRTFSFLDSFSRSSFTFFFSSADIFIQMRTLVNK